MFCFLCISVTRFCLSLWTSVNYMNNDVNERLQSIFYHLFQQTATKSHETDRTDSIKQLTKVQKPIIQVAIEKNLKKTS